MNVFDYPYFIVAPNYRESSLGIQVLHRLCHMINERGGCAMMVGCDVNPEWNTPSCNEQTFNELIASTEPWIAVYPEVVKGNPLKAPVIVRYMLNREGIINGNNIDAGDDDLFFWYREEFADKEPDPKILAIESYDLDLFQDDQLVKDVDLIYINRLPESVIEYNKLPKNIKILSMENPLPLKDLATLLKRARVLYTYESSGTCLLANLCGCPVVALTAKGFESYALNAQTLKDFGNAGFSFSDTPEALQSVKDKLHKVREYMLLKRKILENQFESFVELSQELARKKHKNFLSSSLGQWLNNRVLLEENNQNKINSVRLLHIVFCQRATQEAMANTIDSIIPTLVGSQNILLMVGAFSHPLVVDGNRILSASYDDWHAKVKILAEEERFDWLHSIEAGTCYVNGAITLMQRLLFQSDKCQVIYTDEALINENGIITPCFKPDFNLDLFLSAPQRFLRRLFFRRESWQEMDGFNPCLNVLFEFELVVRLIFKWDLGCIGHVSEVTTLVEEHLFNVGDHIEAKKVIEFYLLQRGFSNAIVEAQEYNTLRIAYNWGVKEKVSILLDAGMDPDILMRCINTLLNTTDWPDIEVLISLRHNISAELQQAISMMVNKNKEIRIFLSDPRHNFAMRMNYLEQQAKGKYILLLNEHCIFLVKSWLSMLMNHIQREEVGCVGPKIISIDHKILSAGMLIGVDSGMGHIGQGENWLTKGYLNRYCCEQNYSALSGNCLLVKRSAWKMVGGLNTDYDNIVVDDIILSLTLHKAGFLCVWTPYSIIASDNIRLLRSTLTASCDDQITRLIKSMPEIFSSDPAYNCNFDFSWPYFRFSQELTTRWDPLSERALPSILFVTNNSGGMNTRRLRTLLSISHKKNFIHLTIMQEMPSLCELLRMKPGILVLGGDINAINVEMLNILKQSFFYNLLVLADDVEKDVSAEWLNFTDKKLLTFYPAQESYLKKHNQHVIQMPIGLPEEWFVIKEINKIQNSPRARILCMPCGWKKNELNFMKDVIAASAHEVDWVILGEWPKDWLPWIKETWRFDKGEMNIEQLRKLNVDAAVVYSSKHDVSRTRSAYPVWQFAACGIPVIASDVQTLYSVIPVVKVKSDHKKWLNAIQNICKSRGGDSQEYMDLISLAKEHFRITDNKLITMINDIVMYKQ